MRFFVTGGAGFIGSNLARFILDKGYLVTFRSIDPLWTIDLQNSHAPRVIGELEVPGVSTYIHPLEDGHLLTIGYGGEEGGFLDWLPQVSLFDVTDFAAPALDSTLGLVPPTGEGWGWGWSEALYEHKAFQYWAPKGLLAVPVSSYRYFEDPASEWGYRYEYSARLDLVTVDPTTGLSAFGAVDHSRFFNSEEVSYCWFYPQVRRSIFMGDFIYTVSGFGVTAKDLILAIINRRGEQHEKTTRRVATALCCPVRMHAKKRAEPGDRHSGQYAHRVRNCRPARVSRVPPSGPPPGVRASSLNPAAFSNSLR